MLGLPYDDVLARQAVQERVELKPYGNQYAQIVKTRLRPLKTRDIVKFFGPQTGQCGLANHQSPINSVAPLFEPQAVLFSGLLGDVTMDVDLSIPPRVDAPPSFKVGTVSHLDLYALGNLGFIEYCYDLDGSLHHVLFYARLDDKFVPLQSTNDFPRRLEWDRAKLNDLEKWLDDHHVPGEAPKDSAPNADTRLTK